jgi:hypothetical protein
LAELIVYLNSVRLDNRKHGAGVRRRPARRQANAPRNHAFLECLLATLMSFASSTFGKKAQHALVKSCLNRPMD